MNAAFKKFLVAAVLCGLPFAGVLASAPSKEEVAAVVKKAIGFYKLNGKDKALVEFNKKDGLFAQGEDALELVVIGVWHGALRRGVCGILRGHGTTVAAFRAARSRSNGW